jgi:uncharacterized protein (DUF2062 family)
LAALASKTHHNVIVVNGGDWNPEALNGLNMTILRDPASAEKGAAVLAAAKAARQMGMTHIVTMDAESYPTPDEFFHLTSVIEQDSNAIILGRRNSPPEDESGLSRFRSLLSNFWLRLQTGKSLKGEPSGVRAYPLNVLENLKLRQRGPAFEVEVLVKAAWAGVTLKKVPLSIYLPLPGKNSQRPLFRDILLITILNIHYTLRSIIPLPHRKIMADKEWANKKITVLHPINSLKTLLTENTTPIQLAAAGALGVFLGTLPLIACHTIAILFAASFFRLNKVAAVSASQLCMPPIVPALCIETGYFMRHGKFLTEISLETLGYQALDRLFEWLMGSLFLAPVIAALVGIIIYVMAILITKKD